MVKRIIGRRKIIWIGVLLLIIVILPRVETFAYNWTRTMSRGSRGNDVKEVQVRVAGWASDGASKKNVKVDGVYGEETRAAVIRFQKAYGLAADGIVGPATQAKLNQLEDKDGSTKNFDWNEFYSNDGSSFSAGKVNSAQVKENVRRTMYKLEALRKKAGNRPIYITSGFRSVKHNNQVKGASNSMHTYGVAADIKVSGKTPYQVQQIAKTCGFSGIIRYNSFVHVDSRQEYPYGSTFWYWP
ncbi:MAG TPA: muramoyltetrapeptide carboxypeptidase [Clostridium sp.]|jgi:zinc D-Ala-D-Ala carboxypeptidase|nr:DUF882 domain-containing protein [Clostridia bacterium]HCW04230.1 muramoyltetrapeptide carboxypeptidase [Clostridium sp.]